MDRVDKNFPSSAAIEPYKMPSGAINYTSRSNLKSRFSRKRVLDERNGLPIPNFLSNYNQKTLDKNPKVASYQNRFVDHQYLGSSDLSKNYCGQRPRFRRYNPHRRSNIFQRRLDETATEGKDGVNTASLREFEEPGDGVLVGN